MKILLVEDNPGYARLIREMFEETEDRFVLTCAPRLCAALDMLAAETPDAVILDLSLPDSQGLATFSQVHERAPNVPIVVLTGLTDEEVAVQAVRSGAQDFLLKSDITAGALARALRYGIMRQRAEMTRAHLAAIVESSGDAIVSTTSDNIILSWNRGAERMFGYPAAEAIGRSVSVLIPPGRSQELAIEENKIKPGEAAGQLETVRVRKDGKEIGVSLSISPITDTLGRIIGTSRISHDITERRRFEGEIRQLSADLLVIQDEERRRIARELHDSTAQNLAAIAINLSLIAKSAEMDMSARQRLADTVSLAKLCSDEIRTVSYLLHPPLLDEMGLASALRFYVESFAQRSGIRVDLEVSPELGRLPKEAETALFRVVQESLTNIHRHSGSPTAKVRIVRDDVGAKLEVVDAGTGIRATGVETLDGRGVRPRMGISGMRERLMLLGGRLEIDSGNQGTTVRASLPLRRRGSN